MIGMATYLQGDSVLLRSPELEKPNRFRFGRGIKAALPRGSEQFLLVRQEARGLEQPDIDSKALIGESVSHRAELYVAFELATGYEQWQRTVARAAHPLPTREGRGRTSHPARV